MQYLLMISIAVFVYSCVYWILFSLKKAKLRVEKRLDDIAEINIGSTARKKGNRVRNLYKRFSFIRVSNDFNESIVLSGLNIRPEEFVLIWFLGALVSVVLVYTFTTNILQTMAIAILAISVPPMYISHLVAKQRSLFQVQLGDVLIILANALRAGFSFQQAMANVAKISSDPISKEFNTVYKEIQLGVDLEESLLKVARRMQSDDLKLLTTAVVVQQQVGGNLSEILDSVAATIRGRLEMQRKVKALTAQGKVTGLVIGGIPIFLLLAITAINPYYMEPLFSTLVGRIILFLGAVMQIIGFVFIRKMVDIKF